MPICLLSKNNNFYSIKKNFKPKFEDIVQSGHRDCDITA